MARVNRAEAGVWSGLCTVLRLILTGAILVYQKLVSPALPPSCRFHPSCSQYALEAVSKHGPFRGTILAAARLLRCNPWNPGGVDLIP